MDSGFSHVIHSIVVTSVLYVIMMYVLKQPYNVAVDRSILIGTILLFYMMLFGHNLPSHGLNPNIM